MYKILIFGNILVECVDGSAVGELGSKWVVYSGGQRSVKCGVLLHGAAMRFSGHADRLLETSELDLVHATSVKKLLNTAVFISK